MRNADDHSGGGKRVWKEKSKDEIFVGEKKTSDSDNGASFTLSGFTVGYCEDLEEETLIGFSQNLPAT